MYEITIFSISNETENKRGGGKVQKNRCLDRQNLRNYEILIFHHHCVDTTSPLPYIVQPHYTQLQGHSQGLGLTLFRATPHSEVPTHRRVSSIPQPHNRKPARGTAPHWRRRQAPQLPPCEITKLSERSSLIRYEATTSYSFY